MSHTGAFLRELFAAKPAKKTAAARKPAAPKKVSAARAGAAKTTTRTRKRA
jgi:hypothetical protein